MSSALAGIRVLDLTNVLAGPFCAYQLALLGAEVVKIEVPDGGDLARQLGADPALNAGHMGASFLAQNAGKKSVTLNLKKAGGKDVLRRLVVSADVLVENFRPGVMARLGLAYEDLAALNPRLVYCAISGFGQEGPMKTAPADDKPRPHGNDNFTAAPSGAFRAKDGLINIAANKQEQFEALVAAVGRPELATDPRFAERESRKLHRGALTLELEASLKNRSCAEWQSIFNKIGVPAGCVLSVPQALALPQVAQRELLKTFDSVPGVDRSITVARSGFKLSGGDPDVAGPPPELGQDTDEVLGAAGYSAEEVAALREAGIV